MALDYKKEYKELYLPGQEPTVVTVPPMTYAAVRGKGNPNEEEGEYGRAVGMLYAVLYTIKMSRGNIPGVSGFIDFVVPPLEGLWWMGSGFHGVDYDNKGDFHWISMIRLPDFVTGDIFTWATGEAEKKKKIDLSKVERYALDEGLCVQCMHFGPYDNEPATVARMDAFVEENGYRIDLSDSRRHHEIYLGDPRKTPEDKMRTVLRHPIAKKQGK